MASKYRKASVKRIATTTPGQYLDVYVTYDDGKGPGYDDGKVYFRCYKLHVQPCSVESVKDTPGLEIKTISAYSGVKGTIEQTARFNQKRMETLANEALTTDLCKNLIEVVLGNPQNKGIAIASDQPFATVTA